MQVENKAGVLSKITALCRRRRYNIQSLTVGTTNQPGISQITVVFEEDKDRINQIANQINKLIEVINIEVAEPKNVIDKELVLLIVKNKEIANRLLEKTTHNIEIKIINSYEDQPIMQIIGSGTEVEHFIDELDLENEVVKLVRSGLIVLKL